MRAVPASSNPPSYSTMNVIVLFFFFFFFLAVEALEHAFNLTSWWFLHFVCVMVKNTKERWILIKILRVVIITKVISVTSVRESNFYLPAKYDIWPNIIFWILIWILCIFFFSILCILGLFSKLKLDTKLFFLVTFIVHNGWNATFIPSFSVDSWEIPLNDKSSRVYKIHWKVWNTVCKILLPVSTKIKSGCLSPTILFQ